MTWKGQSTMKAKQIPWVERDESDPHRRIKRLGGDGFCHSILEAIMNVHHGECRYWMVHDGAPVWVVLDTRPGSAYLRAEQDDVEPDILLSLSVNQKDEDAA